MLDSILLIDSQSFECINDTLNVLFPFALKTAPQVHYPGLYAIVSTRKLGEILRNRRAALIGIRTGYRVQEDKCGPFCHSSNYWPKKLPIK